MSNSNRHDLDGQKSVGKDDVRAPDSQNLREQQVGGTQNGTQNGATGQIANELANDVAHDLVDDVAHDLVDGVPARDQPPGLHISHLLLRQLDHMRRGEVWLIGGGPGCATLITLQGLSALSEGDVIYYDSLLDKNLLEQCRSDAERVDVGKRGGRPSMSQAQITQALIDQASQGKKVVRLKGGDPMVFGRGAEEIAQLVRSDIICRVVPGVPSAVAGLSYAGMSFSHREVQQAVVMLTARDASGGLAKKVDWQALASRDLMLVIHMGRFLATEIADKLIFAGRPADDDVALIVSATRSDQQVILTKLSDLSEAAQRANEGPMLIVIGSSQMVRAELAPMAKRMLERR